MNYRYEPIVKEDLAYIFLLSEEQLKYEDLEALPKGQLELIEELLLEMILSKKETYKAIVDRDYIIGYVCLELMEGYLELVDIFLLEEARHQGHGKRVMADLTGLADELGLNIYLNLYLENKGALKLYRDFGFKDYLALGENKLRMLRRI